ncbi:MAG: hypothetical protein KDI68_15875 [Gammaproteobacteria bacterium]|nr:hypothetical protein [Gammaproteobacteria bacterium]
MAETLPLAGRGAQAALLAALLLQSLPAPPAQEASRHDHLRIRSLLLFKPQCDRAIAGYAERIAPHFLRWRQRHRATIAGIEDSAGFADAVERAVAYSERMSPRARTGLTKDCEKILQTLTLQQ